jgi:hypothetical protein
MRVALFPMVLRFVLAVCLAVSGWVHADLYVHGYSQIPVIGPAFLLQASGSFAVAALLLLSNQVVLWVGAAALGAGALIGFALSRTVGVFGFTETGLQPAPQALISLLAEVAVLVLLALPALRPHLVLPWRRPPGASTGASTTG